MIISIFILILLLGFIWIHIYRNPNITPVLSISLIIYFLFWNIFPITYATFASDRTNDIISNHSYQELAIFQLTSLIIIFVLFSFFSKSRFPYLLLGQFAKKRTNTKFTIITLIFALIIIIIANIYIIKTIGFTFLERTQYVVSIENIENALGAFLFTINKLAFAIGVACFLSDWSGFKNRRWILRLSIIIITSYIAVNFISGSRAFFITFLIIIATWLGLQWNRTKKANKIGAIILLLVILLMAPFLSIWLRTVRSNLQYSLNDIIRASKMKIADSTQELIFIFMDDWYTKLDSIAIGTALIESQGKSRAGLGLITSSLLSPIPRLFFPNKPVPFSINGDYSGIPYYIAAYELGNVSSAIVYPVAPSAVALWELNYLGLILMIFFNIINLIFINALISSFSFIYKACGILLLSFPILEYLIAPTGFLIKEGLRVIILVIILNFIFLLIPKRIFVST